MVGVGQVEEATHRVVVLLDVEAVATVGAATPLVPVADVEVQHIDTDLVEVDHPKRMSVSAGIPC